VAVAVKVSFVLGAWSLRLTVALGAVLAIVTELLTRIPLVVPSLGVASTVMVSPLEGLIVTGGVAPVQLDVENVVARFKLTDRDPTKAEGLVLV
jgi:hypothetical protein